MSTSQRVKKPLTLIELLLVVMICGVTLSVIGFSIPSALFQERFEKSKKLCREKLAQATEVMLDFETDVVVTFSPHDGGVEMVFFTGKSLPPKITALLKKNTFLPHIEKILFEGRDVPLFFDAATCRTPQGRLTLVGKKNGELFLPGYPKVPAQCTMEDVEKIDAPYPKEAFPSA